jgi:hypothetical protein
MPKPSRNAVKYLSNSAVLVSLVVLIGCSSNPVRTEYVAPNCTVPPIELAEPPTWEGLALPFKYLPDVAAQEYDQALTQLERYEVSLVNALLEQRAILRTLCETED